MTSGESEAEVREKDRKRREVDALITALYGPEDDALRAAVAAAVEAGLPPIQISPLQGQLLRVLAAACGARRILEIGALAGYSGIWLARALPPGGLLISLELDPHHAEVVRASFARAGVADRAEVRVGPATDSLPGLTAEAPFDLVFIDADKPGYPAYLDWALRLTRVGSIIVADNVVRNGGEPLRPPADETNSDMAGLYTYNRRVATDPRLRSIALPIDNEGMDGLAISVVVST
jgi:caffeoyl-CoA O-methyltransferase